MNASLTIFSQLIEHAPSKEFQKGVALRDLGIAVVVNYACS
jgi:hypothetical protein